VRDLDLSACEVEQAGATALTSMLSTNGTLTVLRLKWNPAIDDQARAALKDAVGRSSLRVEL
jgi:hypothetical protein